MFDAYAHGYVLCKHGFEQLMMSRKSFLRPSRSGSLGVLVVVLLFAILGAYLLKGSHAATPFISVQPETGATAGTARVISDATASGGKSIQFGSSPTGGFVHPGIAVGRPQLDFVKAKIAAGQEPWKTAFNRLQTQGTDTYGQKIASVSYVPHPVDVVKCATAGGKAYIAAHPEQPELAEQGCSEQTNDAIAAYADALQYYYTGNAAYAQTAIKIMNAWSGKLTTIWFDQPRQPSGAAIYANGKLQAAWTAETITRAAEIIRSTYTPAAGLETFDVPRFSTMLNKIYLPLTIDNWIDCCTNWDLSTTDATIAIGVFTDNKATFDNGIGDWRGHVPAAIYMASDVPKYPWVGKGPNPPPGGDYDYPTAPNGTYEHLRTGMWISAPNYIEGMEAETCRDFGHVTMGLEAMSYAAETARLQGIDLWGEQQARIIKGYEFNTQYAEMMNATGSVPSALCGGKLNTTVIQLGFEIVYNEYHGRKGIAMPYTEIAVNKARPTSAGLHMDYETLTSAGTP
jgi:hypothetical protein